MAIKWLDAKRLQGTNAERLAMTVSFEQLTQNDSRTFGETGGGGGRTFTHHQNSATTTWTINHNLGKFPSVSLKFSSSDNVYTNVGAFAGVAYTNENTITITLAAAESGYAYLN